MRAETRASEKNRGKPATVKAGWATKAASDGTIPLLLLACATGAGGGAIASLMSEAAALLHHYIFGVPLGQRLSGDFSPPPLVIFASLVAGGVIVGMSGWLWKRRVSSDIADPIEANALFGGRMSARGSAFVAFQAIASNGFGASVGLEGGFTQAASALGSWFGRVTGRAREDMRVLVACGAAGGIAGAFDAPITGAAYAFELVLAAYAPKLLAPVALSAICGKYAAGALTGHGYHIDIGLALPAHGIPLIHVLIVGVVCGLLAIALMRGVTVLEKFASVTALPGTLRTVLGGVMVGLLAIASPHVLGAGHGGIDTIFTVPAPAAETAKVLVLKMLACIVAIGMGFRGGLFSASLYLGALTGGVYASLLPPEMLNLTMITAMCAFAAAVVGTPLAMALLAAEATGNTTILPDVMLATIAAVLVVRELFGFSFSIWRLHVRGSPARSAEDITWTRSIRVGDMMRRDVKRLHDTATCAELLEKYPPGSAKRVALVDNAGRYQGLCEVSEIAYEAKAGGGAAIKFAKQKDTMMTTGQSLEDALAFFQNHSTDAVVVVDSGSDRKLAGLLTDSYLLRRYTQELERRRLA